MAQNQTRTVRGADIIFHTHNHTHSDCLYSHLPIGVLTERQVIALHTHHRAQLATLALSSYCSMVFAVVTRQRGDTNEEAPEREEENPGDGMRD